MLSPPIYHGAVCYGSRWPSHYFLIELYVVALNTLRMLIYSTLMDRVECCIVRASYVYTTSYHRVVCCISMSKHISTIKSYVVSLTTLQSYTSFH